MAVSTAELMVSALAAATVVTVSVTALVSTDEATDVAVSTASDTVELELVKLLTTEAAVLFMAETLRLTDTEALAAELEDDEESSEVAVDE